MIGNDVVDLELARTESNWKRKGYLDKIFTKAEQQLIHSSENPEEIVWVLWTKKEAVYKIYNRETSIRAFIPLQIECESSDAESKVCCNGTVYFTKTKIDGTCINSVAAISKDSLSNIINLRTDTPVEKFHGLPFVYNEVAQEYMPISISHHGKYHFIIALS